MSIETGRKDRARGSSELSRVLDCLEGSLLAVPLLAAPWLFGSTEPWAMWALTACGLAGGPIWVIRWLRDRRDLRTGEPSSRSKFWDNGGPKWLAPSIFVLGALFLGYSGVSAWNARATFYEEDLRFEYHEVLSWLPHSYDKAESWRHFWFYLGLFLYFWLARDFLLRKSPREIGREFHEVYLPKRLRLLLGLACANGGLVAFEALIQRLSGECDLLWLRACYWQDGEACFGPYSYRANAAQYLNLLWPPALGLWWYYHRFGHRPRGEGKRQKSGPHVLLLNSVLIIMIAIIVSLSRGGVIILVGLTVTILIALLLSRKTPHWIKLSYLALMLIVSGMAWTLDLEALRKRFETFDTKGMTGRERIYVICEQMRGDFRWLGTGPGSFGAIYWLYREPTEFWQPTAHNDWLESRITFGRIGLSVLCLALAMCLMRPLFTAEVGHGFGGVMWLAVGGVFVHAVYDFPLQIGSILLTVIFLLAVVSVVRR